MFAFERTARPLMLLALLAALPWLAAPLVLLVRVRDSRSLDELPAAAPPDAPSLSVIVPARDEAANIATCVRAILGSSYPRLELIVVDDASSDGTSELARAAAAGDARCRILSNTPLPDGWFGKQWACATGAAAAAGELLLFTDADTTHGAELHARAVRALLDRRADLLTVAGRQELRTLPERLVLPQVFQTILLRYGGTERVNRDPRPLEKIANGQFLLFRRDAYDRLGGHAAVRETVAEDLALAQRTTAAGMRVVLILGEAHLSTRMYRSLGAIVRGWRKNIFAGGREAMPGGRLGLLVFPLALLLPSLFALAPVAGLLLAAFGIGGAPLLAWSAVATGATLCWWAYSYAREGLSPLNALGYPLGAAVYLYIAMTAIARGRNVEWKGRGYVHRG